MSVVQELEAMAGKMNEQPGAMDGLHASYHFHIKDTGKHLQVYFHDGTVRVVEDASDDADCTLTMSESHLRKLLRNDLNTTMAYMTGSLRIDGRLGLALKLQEILKQYQV
ncbi:putative sterol carrier protein [Paenibacillus favisporus]|uniref:Sterol carrier protein n=1 Tax=Paenibacillus favisporus TaxID=221028 RepID=A0ABV2EZR0_9BACL